MTTPRATLPSADAVSDWIEGKDGAGWAVLASTALRASLIGAGMYVAGVRNRRMLLRGAVGGALAIELFVFGYVLKQRSQTQ